MARYKEIRHKLKTGDIVLYRTIGILPFLFRLISNFKYDHTGIIYSIGERIFLIDEWDGDMVLLPASKKISSSKGICILRPKRPYDPTYREALNLLMNKVEQNEVGSYRRLLWRLLIRTLKIKFNSIKRKPIACDLVKDFLVNLKIESYKNLYLTLPKDLLKLASLSEVEILFNEAKS